MAKKNYRLLLMEDDKDVLRTLELVLGHYYESVSTEQRISNLADRLANEVFDLILLDMNFRPGKQSGQEGLFWLKQIKQQAPDTAVILITAYGDIELAVEAMKQDASDFLLKPWTNKKLLGVVDKALPQRKNSALPPTGNDFLESRSPLMIDVIEKVKKVAPTDANVLLLGENGTGKSSLARFLHQHSNRQQQAFVVADLGAVPENLFESTLFGHAIGAFTDAKNQREGVFQAASGGTLFLDEIGNIPLEQQAKLLHVLQSRTVIKLGTSREEPIDIRLITATNSPLDQRVRAQEFRQDLLYRLNTISITVPPLRERPADIPLLYEHFLMEFSAKYDKTVKTLAGTLKKLGRYHWPGNIREFRNALERAFILCDDDSIGPEAFILSDSLQETTVLDSYNLIEIEKMLILKAIDLHHGNLTQAAQALGVTRQSLYRRMEKYDL